MAFTPVTHVLFDMDGLILSKLLNILLHFVYYSAHSELITRYIKINSQKPVVVYRYRRFIYSSISKYCIAIRESVYI